MPDFELNRLDDYSDEALLAELRRAASCTPDGPLSRIQFDQVAKCSSSVIQKHFGSWAKALRAAGLEQRFSGGVGARGRPPKVFADDHLLAELRTVAARLGSNTVTIADFQRQGAPNAETIRRRFGSWGKALWAAGLDVSPLGRRHSEEDYFDNLLTVWTHHGRQPTYGEMDRSPSEISSGAYEARWGTWRLALTAFTRRMKESQSKAPDSLGPTVASRPATRTTAARHRRDRGGAVVEFRSLTVGLRYQVLRRDRFRCVPCGAGPQQVS